MVHTQVTVALISRTHTSCSHTAITWTTGRVKLYRGVVCVVLVVANRTCLTLGSVAADSRVDKVATGAPGCWYKTTETVISRLMQYEYINQYTVRKYLCIYKQGLRCYAFPCSSG